MEENKINKCQKCGNQIFDHDKLCTRCINKKKNVATIGILVGFIFTYFVFAYITHFTYGWIFWCILLPFLIKKARNAIDNKYRTPLKVLGNIPCTANECAEILFYNDELLSKMIQSMQAPKEKFSNYNDFKNFVKNKYYKELPEAKSNIISDYPSYIEYHQEGIQTKPLVKEKLNSKPSKGSTSQPPPIHKMANTPKQTTSYKSTSFEKKTNLDFDFSGFRNTTTKFDVVRDKAFGYMFNEKLDFEDSSLLKLLVDQTVKDIQNGKYSSSIRTLIIDDNYSNSLDFATLFILYTSSITMFASRTYFNKTSMYNFSKKCIDKMYEKDYISIDDYKFFTNELNDAIKK